MEEYGRIFQNYQELFDSLNKILKEPKNEFGSVTRNLSVAFLKYLNENSISNKESEDLLSEYLKVFEKYKNQSKDSEAQIVSSTIFVEIVTMWILSADEYNLKVIRFKKFALGGKARNLNDPLNFVYFHSINNKQRAVILASIREHNREIENSLVEFIRRTNFYLYEKKIESNTNLDFMLLVPNHKALKKDYNDLTIEIHDNLYGKNSKSLKKSLKGFTRYLLPSNLSLEETIQIFLWARSGLRIDLNKKRFSSLNIYEGALHIYILSFYFVVKKILSDRRSIKLTQSDFTMVLEPLAKLSQLHIRKSSVSKSRLGKGYFLNYLGPNLRYYFEDYKSLLRRISEMKKHDKNITAKILNDFSISNLSLLLFAHSEKVVWLNRREHNKMLDEIKKTSTKEIKENAVYIHSNIELQKGYVYIGSRVGDYRVVYISKTGNPDKTIYVEHKSIKKVIFKFPESELRDRITNQLITDLYRLNKQLLVLIPFLFDFLGYIYTGISHGAFALAKEFVGDVVKNTADEKTGLPIGLSWDGFSSVRKLAMTTSKSHTVKIQKGVDAKGIKTETRALDTEDYDGFKIADETKVAEIRSGGRTKGQIRTIELEDKGIIKARVIVLSHEQAKLQGEIRGQDFSGNKVKRSKVAKRIFAGLKKHTIAAFQEIDGENLLNELLSRPKNNNNSRRIFSKMRDKLWIKVRDDIPLRNDFEAAGIFFDSSGAPYFLIEAPNNKYFKVRLDIDHNVPLSIDNTRIIDVDNFQLTSAKENQYVLRIIGIESPWAKLSLDPKNIERNIKSAFRTFTNEANKENSKLKSGKAVKNKMLR